MPSGGSSPRGQRGGRQVCLYFGSFNPLHRAHLQLARYMVERGLCDELWFVLSPLNPLKEGLRPLPFAWRAYYLQQSIAGDDRLSLCPIEELLPEPHYTIRTIRALGMLHPTTTFSLLIGGDNLGVITRWYDYERLLREVRLYVYPRPDYPISGEQLQGLEAEIHICRDAPEIQLAATDIRRAALRGEDLRDETACPELWEELVEQLRALDKN